MPPSLFAIADRGSIYLNGRADLAPASRGMLELLAFGSIYGAGAVVTVSAADPSASFDPLNPSFITKPSTSFDLGQSIPFRLHADDPVPVRLYALNGDILNLTAGDIVTNFDGTVSPYRGAKPISMKAGRDIVNVSGFMLNNNLTDVSLVSAGRDVISWQFRGRRPRTAAGLRRMQHHPGGPGFDRQHRSACG
ncbi:MULTISPECIES: hypothetical protein [Bradyrhizobium]|uniref:hypothetical protein n=1 Tax=Bradyrhizobium elkanii TaxID=29448 RepID=UPI0003F4C8BA|nr:hypothetical protein [Bradyrhizobium elkanii]